MSPSIVCHGSRVPRRREDGSTVVPERFGRIFRARLRAVAASWPVRLQRSLARYLHHPSRSGLLKPLRRGPDVDKPYWLLLPGWLLDPSGRACLRPDPDAPFLIDVLSAQYFLFLGVRMRDDVFDGQWKDHAVVDAAGRLIGEAEQLFSRHFTRRNPFWKDYRRHLRTTVGGIARADALQRSATVRPRELLTAYARVNALFHIAPAAVCRRSRRPDRYAAARRFSDRFSAGAQILDDIADVREDALRGRMNYAAAAGLSASAGLNRAGGSTRRNFPDIDEGLLAGRAGVRVLDDAADLFEGAFRAVGTLRSTCITAYRARCRRAIDGARAEILRAVMSSHPAARQGAGTGRKGGRR